MLKLKNLSETKGFATLFLYCNTRCFKSSFSRARTLKRNQVTKSNEDPLPSNKTFSVGKFSNLHVPSNKDVQLASKVVENIESFDALKIFPTVRAAMLEEIRDGYVLKNTYINDKRRLDLRPSPVQVASVRKINQSRFSKIPKEGPLTENSKFGALKDLSFSNEFNRLKIFTLSAETGSGKTWAYLAPLLSILKEEDLNLFRTSLKAYQTERRKSKIRSVILLPTHELVEQVYDTLKRATVVSYDLNGILKSKDLKDPVYLDFLRLPENNESLRMNLLKWGAGDPHMKLVTAVESSRVDVLITTPSKVMGLAKLNHFDRPFRFFNKVGFCVVDEADTLLDKSWIEDTMSTIRKFPVCKNLVFCSATIPKELNNTLSMIFPDSHSVINITTPQLHKIPKQISIKVVDASLPPYNGSKTRCLAQALYAVNNDGSEMGFVKRILVFVNEKKDIGPLREILIEKYHFFEDDITTITGEDSPKTRLEKIEPFLKPAELLEDQNRPSKINVLISTDLLARGLNFKGVKNIILMDLPNNSVDLVHRIGRTGRMRQSGRVFIITDKKKGKSWIRGLPNAVKRGITLG